MDRRDVANAHANENDFRGSHPETPQPNAAPLSFGKTFREDTPFFLFGQNNSVSKCSGAVLGHTAKAEHQTSDVRRKRRGIEKHQRFRATTLPEQTHLLVKPLSLPNHTYGANEWCQPIEPTIEQQQSLICLDKAGRRRTTGLRYPADAPRW